MEYVYLEGAKPRLLVFFHGTGGDESSLLFLRERLDPEAAVLAFRGDWGEGRQRRFFAPLVEGLLDKADLADRLRDFWHSWKALDTARFETISFIGFSNGANFLLGLLTQYPDLADQYILLHPSALNYGLPLENARGRLLMTVGSKDALVDQEALRQLQQDWQTSTILSVSIAQFDTGHFLNQEELDYVVEWYEGR